jgi:hypothetical protein
MVQDRTRTTPVGPTPGGNFAVGSAPFSPGRSVSSARDILIQHDVAGVAGLQAHFLSATSGGTGPLATSDGTPIFGLDLVQQADNTPLVLGKATVGATTSYYTLKPGSAPALLTVAGQPTAQPVLLNGNGDVAGVIPDPTNLILFIRSAAGVVTVVRTPLLNSGALAGFNNSQQLLYFGQLSNPGITFGYRWKAGTETELKPLNSLANQGVIPTAMNNAGQVVGVTLADRSGPEDVRDVATIWSSARVPVVSSIQSITGDAPYTALSISNAGHVVGNLVTAAGVAPWESPL